MTDEEFDAYLLDGFHDPALVAGFKGWLATRPPCVQALAREFPIGTSVDVNGEVLYLIGYTENDMIIVSPVKMTRDDGAYDEAVARKKYLCAAHVRKAENVA